MDVVGFSIAWGNDAWAKQAERVLALWSYYHGRARTVLLNPDEYDRPDYAKSRILSLVGDGDLAVYMDADTVCMNSTLPDIGEGVLGLAEDHDMYTIRRMEPRLLWYQRRYYNAGYVMVRKTPQTVALFDAWWALRSTTCGVFGDQSALNHLVNAHAAPVVALPQTCNWFMRMGSPPGGTCIMHWAGQRDFIDEQNVRLLEEERRTGLPVRAA